MSPKGHRAQPSQEGTVASMTETVNESSSPSEAYFSDPTAAPQYQERPAAVRRENTIDPRTVPPVIPPDHPARNLIVCFDGTGDQFDADNSNVVQLVSLLKKDDRNKQLVYYQTGIGTYTAPHAASPLKSSIMKTVDLMFALDLDAHVMGGYEFLMENYVVGDKICLFGFSRGAYTARSLAGMLHKVGLLPAGNFQQVPFAYKMYTRADDFGWEQSTEFKKAFCVDVSIEFIGVWDTVDSVGLIPKRLPFTTSNTIVKTFRQALSLDERRVKFKANLWNLPTEEDSKRGTHTVKPSASARLRRPADRENTEEKPALKVFSIDDDGERQLSKLEKRYSERLKMTDVEEVWFSGCHCDIGGGSVSNKTRHSLARIPLRWMIRECFKTNTGIMFDSASLFKVGLDPSTLYPFVVPRPQALHPTSQKIQDPPAIPIPIRMTSRLKKRKSSLDVQAQLNKARTPFLGTEEEEELRDALSPKYDQLKIKKPWWLLEILPLAQRYQKGNGKWETYVGAHMGQPRFIPKERDGFKVHRSVKIRMEAEWEDESKRRRGKKYIPKAAFRHEPQWVD